MEPKFNFIERKETPDVGKENSKIYESLNSIDLNNINGLKDLLNKVYEKQNYKEPIYNEEIMKILPRDEGNLKERNSFLEKRNITILSKALSNLSMEKKDPASFNEGEIDTLVREIEQVKYFPIMYVSAPHIESNISGTFPGEPTPLLYATSVVDTYVRADMFPSMKTPQTMSVMNPAVYNKNFEEDLKRNLETYHPKVIGISNNSEGHHFALKIAQIIKKESPDTIIILGGSHEDGTNPEVYKNNQTKYQFNEEDLNKLNKKATLSEEKNKELVDFVFAGSSPYALMEFLKVIADNEGLTIDQVKEKILEEKEIFNNTEGSGNIFFYNSKEEKINNIELSGTDLERTHSPFIFRGKLTQENRFPVFNGKKTAQVMSGFGCIHRCEFCHESTDSVLYRTKKTVQRHAQDVMTELLILKNQGYDAVFFDDSTFAQDKMLKVYDTKDSEGNIKKISETEKLLDLMIKEGDEVKKINEFIKNTQERDDLTKEEKNKIINSGFISGKSNYENGFFEWGCQTTITQLNKDLIEKMSKAGCTYLYFGLEQGDPDDKSGIQKFNTFNSKTSLETWRERFTKVAEWCNESEIRVGVSLQFGLGENEEKIYQTLDFLADCCVKGVIAKNSISLNINTPYPGTEQWIKIIKDENKDLPSYEDRLKRHPRFETCTQFASLSYEKADKIYTYAREMLGDALIGINFTNDFLNQKVEKYRKSFSRDFYFNDKIYGDYLEGKINGIHLNAASLSMPFKECKEIAEKVFNSENDISPEDRRNIMNTARENAASLVSWGKEGVMFGRNTTEAMSFVYWLAGLNNGDNVLTTNAENLSIQRMFELHMDHGNPKREDGYSSWPTWYSKRGPKYPDFIPTPTNIETTSINFLFTNLNKIKEEIDNNIDKDTKLFCFSHVIRDTGEEMPVKEICDYVREAKKKINPNDPDIFILVDGAQALGNIPKINFEELGCNAYSATPHKTMKSYPVGILYFNPENEKVKENIKNFNNIYYKDEQVILDGMFDESLNVKPNVEDSLCLADIASFSKSVEKMKEYGLNKNDFYKIEEKRKELKNYCIEQLENSGLNIKVNNSNSTSFILNFRIKNIDNKSVAEKLSEKGIFISYIERDESDSDYKYLRVSFNIDNTKEEIDSFITNIKNLDLNS